ncbi:MAG: maleylpyruvate isomerase N-terminal domain-containing protein [Mycobacteriaceae bacterium]|nr:maleylpyruvate isomerase N-terminal domain-containing protein [Mycobacteriaceae bacterium]
MDYPAALLEQNRAFGELVVEADPSTPVPTCPAWTLKQLFRHVGRGDRWAAQIVDDRLSEYLDPREVRNGRPPDDPRGALDWLCGGAGAVVDAVHKVGPDTPVWTFLGPRPAAWWIRRRLHEATVHRADAAIALGLDFELSPELAADGTTEWLERVVAEADSPLADGQALHMHATDTGDHWLLRGGTGGLTMPSTDGAAVPDVDIDGPATGLLLAIVRRRSAEDAGLTVNGDAAVWQTWLDRTPF